MDILDGSTKISDSLFHECLGLESINIPESVTSIGKNAFSGCASLESVRIPESVIIIGPEAFERCTGLKSVNIPANVNCINENTFYACTSLSSVDIADGVSDIMGNAFYGCTSLDSIILPQSILNIYDGAFMSCINLTTIKSLNPAVPTIYNNDAFAGKTYATATLYVPAESVDAYKNAANWRNFRNIKAIATTGIESATAGGQLRVTATDSGIAIDGATGTVEIYNTGGALVKRTTADGGRTEVTVPGNGVYIVKAGGKTAKVTKCKN